MNSRYVSIIHTMFRYGILLGLALGLLLGLVFAMRIYPPFIGYHLITIVVAMMMAGLLGTVFGGLAGLVSGMTMALLTRWLFADYGLRSIYKLSMAVCTSVISASLFLKMAYLIGRPYIYHIDTNITWVWTCLIVILCAAFASGTVADDYLRGRRSGKLKNY